MLERLFIKNYLIIKEAELKFTKGLNILTGETGAGKTIIIDALSLILGERADYSIVKDNNDKLVIEGQFEFNDNEKANDFLKYNNLITDDFYSSNTVVLRRELLKKGMSRSFINDIPVSISQLKKFGDIIIDIHSQNEHQSLLKKESHIELLDNFISDEELFIKYKNDFSEYQKLVNKYEDLVKRKNDIFERKNFIEFQLKEINNVNPQEGEEQQLENELNKIENTEDISLSLSNSLSYLYENENNVIADLSSVSKELKKVVKYDSELNKVLDDIESSYISLKEAVDTLNNYRNSVNFDPVRIEQIRNRLGSLNFLKKKYNLSESELINKANKLSEELDSIENFDFEIEQLQNQINEKKEKLFNSACKISSIRKNFGKKLEKNVDLYLREVGLASAEFKVYSSLNESEKKELYTVIKDNKTISISEKGIDDVEFMVKINKGSEYSPLRKTASGGEVSRIMLAIKASLSGRDKVPVLVFDEIDAGISGRIADKVGKVLKQLSKSHQIISITHLPQIAAMSDVHFQVSKIEEDKKTIALITTLSEKEKIEEIAKLLSGEKVTEVTTQSAKELIGKK